MEVLPGPPEDEEPHLQEELRLNRVFILAGVCWLGILIALSLNDFLTPGWLPVTGF